MFHSRATASLLLVLALFVWAGMVAGISFLEAPLKFTAPRITIPLGLGIGRIVFAALNKVELGLAAVAVASGIYLRVPTRMGGTLGVVVTILALQTLWLLPALDVRALALLAGHPAPPSSLHTVYIGLEVVKLLTLLLTGCWVHRWALRAAHQQPRPTTAQAV
ncbi:hypothetical protein HNQ93_001231 [Hymenobacter luteus]|uniref:DUF4149 domain-containing protein n=2 Tax=Hymenobacter TaxID=89966 RepID=A0A7W9WBG0_9BACT|nr:MULTISPECIES: hypothetical protein [Hymenobacter]MBB4601408.1 hypothetical protein [Hymenobacter latericoloratus]MBB6058385.1 hypothetical protein [Hymenobacter luteus]